VVTRGHRPRSHQDGAYQKKELTPSTLRFRRRKRVKVAGAIRPTPRR
jgi:hypothetical protein